MTPAQKFDLLAEKYAVKLIVDWTGDRHPAEATDDEMRAAFAGCARVAPDRLYPAIRVHARRLFDSGEIRTGVSRDLRTFADQRGVSLAEHWTDDGRLLFVVGDAVLSPVSAALLVAA